MEMLIVIESDQGSELHSYHGYPPAVGDTVVIEDKNYRVINREFYFWTNLLGGKDSSVTVIVEEYHIAKSI
jgi:hypothetical protein